MERKNNKSSKYHSFFIKLAFEQAKINLGSTGSNPSVGCVVIKNDTVVSSGHTSVGGRPHAERNALKNFKNLKDAHLYVSLEPCSHFGVTPPCTNQIIKKKIKNVFFSISDVDKRSANRSFKTLKKKNIRCTKGFSAKYGNIFYKSYFLSKIKKKPLIDAKIAISNDFYTKNKLKKWITNKYSRKCAHLLRSRYDCLISTSKTINDDNAILNCRIDGLEHKSPSIAIIDRDFKIKKNLNIFKNAKRKIYIFTTSKNKRKRIYFTKRRVKIISMDSMKTKNDYLKILSMLNKFGFSRILVESGEIFLNFLKSNGLINNLYIFKSNIKLHKNGFKRENIRWLKNIKIQKKVNVNLLGDILYEVKLNNV